MKIIFKQKETKRTKKQTLHIPFDVLSDIDVPSFPPQASESLRSLCFLL